MGLKTKKLKRKVKKTRKQKGGEDYLRLQYTKNPARAAWVEALYPLGPYFFQLIDSIPWAEYKYEGPTESVLLEVSSDNYENTTTEKWQKQVPITAKTFQMPYKVLGGAACEIFNLHYTGKDTPRLEDTTDPTGDIDCTLARLELNNKKETFLTEDELNHLAKGTYSLIFPFLISEGTSKRLSKVYDHYSKWLFEQVCAKLEPLKILVSATPKFAPKERGGNTETEIADLERHVGNFLVTRAHVNNMLKIQVGLGVRYNGKIKGDHCIEFILPMEENLNELSLQSLSTQTLFKETGKRIEPLSPKFTFGINVSSLKELIADQAEALAARGKELVNTAKEAKKSSEQNMKQLLNTYGHKSYNHYGRLLYLLKLLKYLVDTNQHPQPGIGDFYLLEKNLLRGSALPSKEVQACYPRCNFDVIRSLITNITAYRPIKR